MQALPFDSSPSSNKPLDKIVKDIMAAKADLVTVQNALTVAMDRLGKAEKTLTEDVGEIVKRLVVATTTAFDPPADGGGDTVPAEPIDTKPPDVLELSGADRIEEVEIVRTVVIDENDSPNTVLQKLDGNLIGTRVVVRGSVPPFKIGEGKYDLSMTPTGPNQGCEITSDDGAPALIRGIKLTDASAAGQLIIGDVEVTPEQKSDGSEQGDFAAIRSLTAVPDLHLILAGTRTVVPDGWSGYDGFGMKWATFLKGLKLTVLGLVSDSPREHVLYGHNLIDAWVEGARNTIRMVPNSLGVWVPLGCGRTLLQSVNRVPQVTVPGTPFLPKGGSPSTGRIVYHNCVATGTGWEGVKHLIDSSGNFTGNPYGGGGGAAFTIANHTGIGAEISGCEVLTPYANGIAAYADYGKDNITDENPQGYRGWMINPNSDEVMNPLESDLSDFPFAHRSVEINRFLQDRVGSRTPILVAGTRELRFGGVEVAGESVDPLSSPHVSLDYQDGVRVIQEVY